MNGAGVQIWCRAKRWLRSGVCDVAKNAFNLGVDGSYWSVVTPTAYAVRRASAIVP